MAGGSIHDLKIEREPEVLRSSTPWLLFAVLLILVLLGGGFWFGYRDVPLEVATIRVESVSAGEAVDTVLNATGYVTARTSATVSSKVTGKIQEVLVEEGMRVANDQVLARLDPSNVRAVLNLVTAQWEASRAATDETAVLVAEAELDYSRTIRLAEEQIASQSDLDAARARLQSLRARLKRLESEVSVAESQVALNRQDLADLEIRAPFDGVVISKDAQPGEMISPVSAGSGFTRTGICTLVDMSSLEIEVDVNESYINRVEAGQPVVAVLDAYAAWQIPASVIAIVPSADRQKATVRVRIRFEALDPRILPDMGVKVSFQNPRSEPEETVNTPVVGLSTKCLWSHQQKDYVWVVAGGKVEKRAVKVRSRRGGQALVEAGVQAGEVLVVDPSETLQDGDSVKVK